MDIFQHNYIRRLTLAVSIFYLKCLDHLHCIGEVRTSILTLYQGKKCCAIHYYTKMYRLMEEMLFIPLNYSPIQISISKVPLFISMIEKYPTDTFHNCPHCNPYEIAEITDLLEGYKVLELYKLT